MTNHEDSHNPGLAAKQEAADLLSVERVAKRLGISESGVYRLTKAGELSKLKVGTRTMFEPAEVERYIARCRATSRTEQESNRSGHGRRAVVLLSGGLDSATVLAMAQNQGYEAYAISFRYGQRHAIELEAAHAVAEAAGIPAPAVTEINLGSFGGSALTADIAVPKHDSVTELGDDIPSTYVPARNTIFLSCAFGYAEVLEADDIFIGVNALDYSGYPDCRPEYINRIEDALNVASKRTVEGHRLYIHTPLIDITKGETVRRGLAFGVDYSLTRSCYDPSPAGEACAHCDSCLLRLRAFAENGLQDPISYQSQRLAA
jgi:7-cyano-7-deazaguanine synthase